METAADVLKEIEQRSRWEFLPIIGAEKAAFLEQLVRDKRPCRAIEVGVMTGYTTIVIAKNLPSGCHLLGIEISEDMARQAEANLARSGFGKTVMVIRGDARERLADATGTFDLVFLDAQKSQYLSYLKKLEPKLNPGAVIVANGVAQFRRESLGYLDYVRKSDRYQSSSRVFGGDAMEVSIFKG